MEETADEVFAAGVWTGFVGRIVGLAGGDADGLDGAVRQFDDFDHDEPEDEDAKDDTDEVEPLLARQVLFEPSDELDAVRL